jgi:LIVCS family branched-chain amino acid:cation transporter
VTNFFTKTLPLGQYTMGWIPLAVTGFVLGFVWHKVAKN